MTTDPPTKLRTTAMRSFHHREFDRSRLTAAKGSTVVSVCLPARNEAATIGPIVATLRDDLLRTGIVDEIVVIDDHSTDRTAPVARHAGARVVGAEEILPTYGEGHGKGEVLWKSLMVAEGDVIVWCDADLVEFGSHLVSGLLGPLLCEPDVDFVKGHYLRPLRDREGGGRVTELVARPMLSLLFPELAGLRQPLAGEYGGRREVLERLPFVEGYGVDVALLVDCARLFGVGGMVQVDLDVRLHRNRDLTDLGPQAMAIMQTLLRRIDPGLAPEIAELVRPDGDDVDVDVSERPPMIQVAEYLARHEQSMPHGA